MGADVLHFLCSSHVALKNKMAMRTRVQPNHITQWHRHMGRQWVIGCVKLSEY